MTKTIVLATILLVVSASGAAAQTRPEVFGPGIQGERACLVAAQSGNYTNYVPSVLRQVVLGPNEAQSTYANETCVEMDVADRVGGGRQWVIVAAGTPRIIDTRTGGTLRHGMCNNRIYAEAPFTRAVLAPPPAETATQSPVVRFETAPAPIRESINRVDFTPFPTQQTTRIEVDNDVDEGGLSKWIKIPLIVGGVALAVWGAYEGIQYIRNRNSDDNRAPDVCQVVAVGVASVNVNDRCSVTVPK